MVSSPRRGIGSNFFTPTCPGITTTGRRAPGITTTSGWWAGCTRTRTRASLLVREPRSDNLEGPGATISGGRSENIDRRSPESRVEGPITKNLRRILGRRLAVRRIGGTLSVPLAMVAEA